MASRGVASHHPGHKAASRRQPRNDPAGCRHRPQASGVERMSRVVAEITAWQNRTTTRLCPLQCQLEAGGLGLGAMSQQRSQWPRAQILGWLGVPHSVCVAWRACAHNGLLEDHRVCSKAITGCCRMRSRRSMSL